jgi:hypothetical protein
MRLPEPVAYHNRQNRIGQQLVQMNAIEAIPLLLQSQNDIGMRVAWVLKVKNMETSTLREIAKDKGQTPWYVDILAKDELRRRKDVPSLLAELRESYNPYRDEIIELLVDLQVAEAIPDLLSWRNYYYNLKIGGKLLYPYNLHHFAVIKALQKFEANIDRIPEPYRTKLIEERDLIASDARDLRWEKPVWGDGSS